MSDTAINGEDRYCSSLEGLNKLLQVTRILALEVDLATLLDTIVAEARHAIACERAILYQFDAKRNVLSATAGLNRELRLRLDQGVQGFVARKRTMVNLSDATSDGRWDPEHDQATGFRTETVLALPLIAPRDGRLLGVLEFLNNHGGPFCSDDEALALAFGHHAAAALDRARLIDEIHARKELETSLSVAREIQRRFMPTSVPQFTGYEAATWWYPNEAVGGDYCDVIALEDGRIALCVADVSGHGLGPSLLMASVRAALRTLLTQKSDAQQLLERVATVLADDFDRMFVTMIVALVDPKSHTVEFANAGHAPALLYRAASGGFETLDSTGLPLGVLDKPACPLGPLLQLEPGDLLLLGTDGIVEAMDDRGNQFGTDRLKQLISRLARLPLPDVVRNIGREVELHYIGDSPPDDLTVLALRRTPATVT
jgi:phosphoserine phosphatase RsbU/P